jgi:KipI family sensor histidine kinase inhibitor
LRYLQIEGNRLEIQNYYDDYIILKNEDHQQLPQIAKAIYESQYKFVDDVIATEVEILIKLNKFYESGHEMELENIKYSIDHQKRRIQLPIYFNEHSDWEYVAEHTGLSKEKYIHQLQKASLSVAMYGFMPGFIYISGLPFQMQVPRKENPSIKIPKNSFALGGPYAGIYSIPSPGGWHIIGLLATPIISKHALPPIKLNIGDSLSPVAISESQYNSMIENKITLESYNGIS